ncbi:MAG: ATP-binding protein [Candidatus Verstraetearchaeota archaeon]|nr:ATP-binding protein [Candidatus Verstraetearchaeota archaeon]
MRRVKLSFATGVEVDFCDRDRAIKQVEDFAERGTRFPVVVFGPEGCGKTAWLKQAAEVLKGFGFSVIYFNPVRREFLAEVGIEGIERRALEVLKQASSVNALAGFIGYVIDFAREAIRLGRGRIAVIVDDAFQFIGGREASFFVKGLLEVIEHPPEGYERIVAIAATSEGESRGEIGRHLWANLMPMWNMPKMGFEELYGKLPDPKPKFEDVWAICGGNPRILSQLYEAKWDIDMVIAWLIRMKDLTRSFVKRWEPYLKKVVEDPQSLWEEDFPSELKGELIAKNLIVHNIYDRNPKFWIDEPPPEKDLELGIGRDVAWQTPIHREAVRRAITQY